jgi:serine/threonine protein kinase/formylglycine-generating enzyme required for sulfatase activity
MGMFSISILKKNSHLTIKNKVSLLRKVCNVIGAAHTKGIIHRDLKPANIMVLKNGEIKVLDFGLAKMRVEDESMAMLTGENDLLGTPAYMAPEQASSKHDQVDTRTDIYALGTMLYEIVTGNRPFMDKSIVGLIYAVVHEPHESISYHGVGDRDLGAIIDRCLAKRPKHRYPSVLEFDKDLERWSKNQEVSVRPRSVIAKTIGFVKRHYLVFSAIILLSLLTGAMVAYRAYEKRANVKALLRKSQGHLKKLKRLSIDLQQFDKTTRTDMSKLQNHFAGNELMKKIEEETVNALITIEKAERIYETQQAKSVLLDIYMVHIILSEKLHYDSIFQVYQNRALKKFKNKKDVIRIKGIGRVFFGDKAKSANVTLFKISPDKRGVLLPGKPNFLGSLPIEPITLKLGSYVLKYQKDGYVTSTIPILIERNVDLKIDPYIFKQSEIPNGYIYVPGGVTYTGNVNYSFSGAHYGWKRLKVKGFFMRKHPFTLNDLVEFLKQRPIGKRKLFSTFVLGKPMLRFDDARGGILHVYGKDFTKTDLVEGKQWGKVAYGLIDFHRAKEIVDWEKRKLKNPCVKIPTKYQYERAARGADGRNFTWGNVWVKGASAVIDRKVEIPLPAIPGKFPLDISIFGITDLTGNVMSWTETPYKSAYGEVSDYKIVVGGSYSQFPNQIYENQWYDISETADELSVRPVIPLSCFLKSR